MKEHRPDSEALPAAFELAAARLDDLALSDQSDRVMQRLWARFASYTKRCGIVAARDINAEVVSGFVRARAGSGSVPSASTMHLRRSALRLLFRIWRECELATGDPTLDLALPARSQLGVRPLTDDEVAICRWASLSTPAETRQPATWAAAEAGLTTGEIPLLSGSDLDLDSAILSAPGTTKTDPRSVPITAWGVAQLCRRIAVIGDPGMPLCYEGTAGAESGQASVCRAIADVLRRAGLADEPDVRPRSVTAWVGVQVFVETESIEEVARRLGMRSLDRTASLIGHDWRTSINCSGGKS